MSFERLSINRFQLPQASAVWEQRIARFLAALAKVPLHRWQFFVRLILVLSLSFSLAHLFWLLLPAPVIPPAAIAIPVVATQVATDNSAINIAQLKSLAVFGKAEAPVKAENPVPENQAVDSSLNLTLMGVIASSDESLARAIITAGDKTEIYAIGNPLPVGNNATLTKVMADRVIINNNGQYESLWLYQNNPSAPPISQAQPQSQVQPSPPLTQSYDRVRGSGNPGLVGPQMHSPGDSPQPASDAAAVMGAEVSRNLSDVVAMSIYREGGQVIGYKIRPGRDGEKFKSLGLQTDDIVTAVNGMPLTNPAKIMEVYKNMGNTTSASLEIKRGGSVMTVDVVLQ